MSDRGEEQAEMDQRARRLGHLGLRRSRAPTPCPVLPDERRVPVAARGEAAGGRPPRSGSTRRRPPKATRASDEPPLLDDQDVVELAPEERLEREQLFPARGLLGGAARPERHVTILAVSLSRRSVRAPAAPPGAHQPADERRAPRRARPRGRGRPPRPRTRSPAPTPSPVRRAAPPRGRGGGTRPPRALAPRRARPRVETISARRTVRTPARRRGPARPGGPRRRARGRRRPGTRGSRCARRADARARTRGASGPGAESEAREAEPRRARPGLGPTSPAATGAGRLVRRWADAPRDRVRSRRPPVRRASAGRRASRWCRRSRSRSRARLDLGLPRRVRHVVEVAVRVGRLVVDRRRQDALLEREHRDDRLDAAGGAEEVAGHRLRRRHRQARRAWSPNTCLIARVSVLSLYGRRGAVGVDVADVLGPSPASRSAAAWRESAPSPLRVGRGHVVGVGRHAVPDDLRVDARAAPARVLGVLQHDDPRPLAGHEPVAVGVERAARPAPARRCAWTAPSSARTRRSGARR